MSDYFQPKVGGFLHTMHSVTSKKKSKHEADTLLSMLQGHNSSFSFVSIDLILFILRAGEREHSSVGFFLGLR